MPASGSGSSSPFRVRACGRSGAYPDRTPTGWPDAASKAHHRPERNAIAPATTRSSSPATRSNGALERWARATMTAPSIAAIVRVAIERARSMGIPRRRSPSASRCSQRAKATPAAARALREMMIDGPARGTRAFEHLREGGRLVAAVAVPSAGANPIQLENGLPGTMAWELPGSTPTTIPNGSPDIKGMSPPSQCSSLGECPARRPGHSLTTPAPTPTCGAGSRVTGRVWTTSIGCVGRRAFAARCVRVSRGGSSRTVGGRVVGAVVVSRRRPGRSSMGRGRR